ncbi:TolC family outer membrane protein [Burkholderia cepacia]|nr:TolC family outer membrane protein [Burkholderia cepacia]
MVTIMTRTARLLTLLTLAWIPLARAETDLLAAAKNALAHDPGYAAALAQHQADATKRRQGHAGFLPQVVATGNVRYGTVDQETTGAHFSGGGFGSSNGIAFDTRAAGATGAGWAITIKENLFSAERNAVAVQMNAAADAGDAQLAGARQSVILEVAQTYFAILLAEDDVAALNSTRAAALEARDFARARFETGDASITDVRDAEARADLASAQLIAAQTALDLKRAELRDLTGNADTALRHLGRPSTLDTIDAGDFADWQARAMTGNPLIALRRLGMESARAEAAKYRPGAGTTVDAFASYIGDRTNGTGYGGNSSMRNNSAVVGVMVTIPLYTGGLRNAKRDESAALLRKAGFDEEAARIAVAREVRQSFLGLRSAMAQVAALALAVRSAERQLNANQTGFEAGDRPSIDVLNAQQALYTTRRDLAAARYQLVMNRLRLAAAAGELDETLLERINGYLQ